MKDFLAGCGVVGWFLGLAISYDLSLAGAAMLIASAIYNLKDK